MSLTSPPKAGGYTLIEMVTTVAVLFIVLGLMVSLARYVRVRSSTELTGDLLRKLDTLMEQYMARNGGQLPAVVPLISGQQVPDEATLARNARLNNADFVRKLSLQNDLSGKALAGLSIATYDRVNIRDAWGDPIVLMPAQHPAIGMAPQNRFFFFSAGPDRQYLTRADNLYSYESGALSP